MRNIYHEDFSSEDLQELKPDSRASAPTDRPSPERPVRHAKQAPPPIQKKVVAPRQPSAPAENAPPMPYGQPPFYPQPVFYQPDANGQPVPVFYAPQPYMPVPYPQPAEPAPAKTPSVTPISNNAGTRVLFQSADFDKREEASEDTSDFGVSDISESIDLSEISLNSGKRAPEPKKAAPASFEVDDMEIGTYEFNIMTAGQTAKTHNVLTPDEELQQSQLSEESYIDEIYEYEDEEEYVEADEDEGSAIFTLPDIKLPSKEIIRRSVLVISVVAIVIACATLLNEYRLHRQNKKLMNDISGMIITEPTTFPPTDKNSSGKKPQADIPTTLPLQERPLSVEEQWEAIKSANPDVVFPEGIQLKYAKLYAQNTDLVGYLYADGSELDTPIVQGENDNEYVERNFNGEYTKYACPFVTSSNQIRELDGNTVVYGHHMRDGSIFGKLDQYRTVEGYKEAPVITFNTIYNDYSFKVIAAFITNIDPKDDNGYVFTYYWTNLNNELNRTAYLNQLSQRSLYDTGVDVLPSDKLLTLSTCCKDFENARFVVVARLVRPGESTDVDTSKALENNNPRFPQAYYDEIGKKNPFAEAYKWEIS